MQCSDINQLKKSKGEHIGRQWWCDWKTCLLYLYGPRVCSAAENGKSWFIERTTHGWWLGDPSQFWVVRQSIIWPWNQLKNGQNEPIGIRVLFRHKYKWIRIISASVESYLLFHSKIFCAKPEEFVGRQMDYRGWDLGSPGGYMGRIWRPGNKISVALGLVSLSVDLSICWFWKASFPKIEYDFVVRTASGARDCEIL